MRLCDRNNLCATSEKIYHEQFFATIKPNPINVTGQNRNQCCRIRYSEMNIPRHGTMSNLNTLLTALHLFRDKNIIGKKSNIAFSAFELYTFLNDVEAEAAYFSRSQFHFR